MFTIESDILPNRDPLDDAPWGLLNEGQSFHVDDKVASFAKVEKACSIRSALLRRLFVAEKEAGGSRVFLISEVVRPSDDIEAKVLEIIKRGDDGETLGIIINKTRRFGRKIVIETINDLLSRKVIKMFTHIHPRKLSKVFRYKIN